MAAELDQSTITPRTTSGPLLICSFCLPSVCQNFIQGLCQKPPWLPKWNWLSSLAHCGRHKVGTGGLILCPNTCNNGEVHTVGAPSVFVKPVLRRGFTFFLDRGESVPFPLLFIHRMYLVSWFLIGMAKIELRGRQRQLGQEQCQHWPCPYKGS